MQMQWSEAADRQTGEAERPQQSLTATKTIYEDEGNKSSPLISSHASLLLLLEKKTVCSLRSFSLAHTASPCSWHEACVLSEAIS